MFLKLMYITNRPEIAQIADKYGVDRVWIDLETLGKEERQRNMNTVKSCHTINDIRLVKKVLKNAKMLVRVNPWNESSINEINAVIDAGADMVMIPMWKSVKEVKNFLSTVNGRAKTILLLETKEAVDKVDDVLELSFDEIHIGLNDLHLAYGMTFMFELLSDGTVEYLCNKFRKKNIPYGFGGIAKLGDGLLPAERIVMEHYRLGSTRAIISRTFCNSALIDCVEKIDQIFSINIKALRNYESMVEQMEPEQFTENTEIVKKNVADIVKVIKKERKNA